MNEPKAIGTRTKAGTILRADWSYSEEQWVYTVQTPTPHIKLRLGERQL
jgi:hypothetical protein